MSGARITVAVIAVLLAAGAGAAYAAKIEFGSTKLSTTIRTEPRELPSRGGAPLTLNSVTRIGTTDGSAPETLAQLEFLIDKHGYLDARGLPVCDPAKLADATPSQARSRCRGALVGEGLGRARVDLPGLPAQTISSPVSFFNGPRRNGLPSLVAHAYERVPAPKALVVPIAVERVRKGRYGYRVRVELPEIAAGFGAATLAEASVGRTFRRAGEPVGFVNAACSGGRLQVQGSLRFRNGDRFPAILTSSCRPRG